MNLSHPQDRVADWWRQWKHPREFRVAPQRLSAAQCERIERQLAALDTALTELADAREAARAAREQAKSRADAARAAAATAHPATATDDPAAQFDTARLAEAATGVWKAQRKLEQQDGALRASRQIGKSVRTARQALQDGMELTVQDHDGDDYDPGQSLKVLSFEDDPALTREVVLETFQPSVYFRGRLIRMGEVVVGRPPHQ